MKKHLLSDFDMSTENIESVLNLAMEIKKNPIIFHDALKGKILGMVFQKSSTRTKASFESAIYQLGGRAIFLDQTSSQLGRGESLVDTITVLSRYTNLIAARVFSQTRLEQSAVTSSVPLINALSDSYHPCQALADMLTVYEKKGTLNGVKLAYLGDGQTNVAHSLLITGSKLGLNVAIASPNLPEYQPQTSILNEVQKLASSSILITDDVKEAVNGADILYTDTWTSMGKENNMQERLDILRPYQVNSSLLTYTKPLCIVMHCMPAHPGKEITSDILYGSQSVIYDQAENRLHVQKALLLKLASSLV